MRRRLVRVSLELITDALQTGHAIPAVVVEQGLPAGARVIDARHEGLHGYIELVIEHESFEPFERGTPIPILDIRMRRA